jgi:histo-blood group ABO system transferase
MQKHEPITISVLLIATNKYKQFVLQLLKSIDRYFFVNDEVTIVLFTDDIDYFKALHHDTPDRLNITFIQIPPYKFPEATLLRYKLFSAHKAEITTQYCFYLDVDTLVVDYVDREILPNEHQKLTAVLHCGFYNGGGSWETNIQSQFYTAFRDKYYAGGCAGGLTNYYLHFAESLDIKIDKDLESGIMPVWHDESAWNWLLSLMPNIRVLTPDYCLVEQIELRILWGVNQFKPKIIALNKLHDEIRN